jgi:Spy/CpxP family protein refolding chaperone
MERIMPIKTTALALALSLCMAASAAAEGNGPDPVGDALIPPDVIMSHQDDLGLSDEQKAAIQADVQRAQMRFVQLQFRLSNAVEKLGTLLKQSHIDETKAMAQLNNELSVEHEVKQTQLLLMIQVKNELTAEQQAKAFRLKHDAGH